MYNKNKKILRKELFFHIFIIMFICLYDIAMRYVVDI